MPEKTKMIRIKWVRSGIGFTRHQKTIVRSLGLTKLNHTVVRPDTPQIRGIVAAVPHLLEIVPEPVAHAWASKPEYSVHAPIIPTAAAPDEEPASGSAPAIEATAGDANSVEEPSPNENASAPESKE